MTTIKKKFRIESIEDELPVNFRYFSQEPSSEHSIRCPSFDTLGYGRVTAVRPYKPISRIIIETNEQE